MRGALSAAFDASGVTTAFVLTNQDSDEVGSDFGIAAFQEALKSALERLDTPDGDSASVKFARR